MSTVMAPARSSSGMRRVRRLACAPLSAAALVALGAPVGVAATTTAATATTTIPTATATIATATPSPATTVPGAVQQTTGTHVLVVHKSVAKNSKLSNTAIAAAAVAALIALGCLVWGIARMLAYEPRWTLSLRHAMAEAGFRASATWAEFGDWIRLGR
jgi:hypothetical protein